MIDITNCTQIASDFEGSERKFAILYQNEAYMVKEPDPVREKNNKLSYMNNTFSEHIGCNIFKMLDLPVQETFLAQYTRSDGKSEIVVACKDFRQPGEQLYEADKYAKSIIDSKNITKPDYSEIEQIFNKVAPNLNEDVEQRFWDTFVVDAFIGNKDRHLGNWGFLSKDRINLTLAPIYDCGSSLGALIDNDRMKACMDKDGLMANLECNIYTNFTIKRQSVTYKDIMLNPSEKLIKSIKTIVPKIDIDKITSFIKEIPEMEKCRKEYIIKSLTMRYEKILKQAFNKIIKAEKKNSIGLCR